MKIATFTNTYYPIVGGIEKSIETFVAQMRRMGHESLIIAPEYDGARESTDEVLRLPAIKKFAGTPYSLNTRFPIQLANRLRKFDPDLVHSHQPFLLGDSALRVARELDVPLVYSNHTFMERYLHWFPVDWDVLRDIAERLPVAYANLADHVISPTPGVATTLRNRGVMTPITPISTGIDAQFYASGDRERTRSAYGFADSHFVVGHLGRLNPEKNLDYLAEVVLAFIRRAPDRRRFLLVGEGDSVAGIRKMFVEAGLETQLILAGLKQGHEVPDAYAAMDTFLFASLTDTQGLVLSEAMAAGNPVFALDAPGACDMVRHGHDGVLVPPDTPAQAFADLIESVIQDRDRFTSMQAAAVQSAGEVSIAKCTEALLLLYQSIIDHHQGAAGPPDLWERLVNRWEVEIDLIQEKIDVMT